MRQVYGNNVRTSDGYDAGKSGKQDKGSVSRPCSSDCLHIVFLRDMDSAARDLPFATGANPSFPCLLRETCRKGSRNGR
jgi:hypothetical protein